MRRLIPLLVLVLAAACKEELTIPTDCPDFCPGGELAIRDTVIDPIADGDSTYFGYIGRNEALGMLAATGSTAGTAYSVVSFDRRLDSVLVGSAWFNYAIDSVAIEINLLTRDTVLQGTRLLLYRVPALTDSTASFTDIEALLTPDRLIDSMVIADTVKRGYLTRVFSGANLDRVAIPAADSGRLSLVVKVHSEQPTGVRLGARVDAAIGPGLRTWVTTTSTVVAEQKQTILTLPVYTGFVRDLAPLVDPDLLTLGGNPSHRAMLRFAVPAEITDKAVLMRATLELTPARPYYGLVHDSSQVEVRAIVADLGYRSPPVTSGATSGKVPVSGNDVFRIEVLSLVGFWRSDAQVPQVLYLSFFPEGHAFTEPTFYSTRSATGRPRLRITYALPGRPEIP